MIKDTIEDRQACNDNSVKKRSTKPAARKSLKEVPGDKTPAKEEVLKWENLMPRS